MNLREKKEFVEQIEYKGQLLAIIVRSSFNQPGITFFTEDNLSQQLAYMRHSTGKEIDPHVHNEVPREVHFTQEVLIIKRGVLRVDFFTNKKKYLKSRIIKALDVVMLIEGGHGFKVLEEVEFLEVKQGPYAGEQDKIKFQRKLSHEEICLD